MRIAFSLVRALLFLAVSITKTCASRILQEERYFADGGYQAEPTPCAFPWTYESADGEIQQIDQPCVSFSNFEVYIGQNQDPESPSSPLTNTSLWCSTVSNYKVDPQTNDKSVRKMWGYCLDTATNSPTTSPSSSPSFEPTTSPSRVVFLADGGGVESGMCIFPFTYNGVTYDECVDINSSPPYIPKEPISPKFMKTDTSRWCAIENSEYIADPPGNDKSARKLWGYCVNEVDAVLTTSSPTILTPTPSPTLPYFADGGFQEDLTACSTSWQFKEKINDETIWHDIPTICISFDDFQPYGYDDDGVDLILPAMNSTDVSLWCSTTDIYNPQAEDNPENRKNWGYCYNAAFSPRPTSTRTPSLSPSVTPGTIQPSGPYILVDGGGVETGSCIFPFTDDESGTVFTACASITESPPYMANIIEPKYAETDQTKWCAVEFDVYVKEPTTNDKSRRKKWGFCLDTDSNMTSRSESPTIPPINQEDVFYADGGFQEQLTACSRSWKYKETSGDEKILHEVSDVCIRFDEYKPYGYENSQEQLLEPTMSTTNTSLWCSTSPVYNPEPENDINNRLNWGYCYHSSFISSPTVPTTPRPSATPTTESPTVTRPLGDGGGVEEGACIIPFTDQESGMTFDECASFTEYPPYTGNNGNVFPPKYAETDKNRWCAVEYDIYIKEPTTIDKSRRKKWAYCLDPSSSKTAITNSPTVEGPNYKADGGGYAGVRSCAKQWMYKLPSMNGGSSEQVEMESQCIGFDEFKPYGYNDPLVAIEPSNSFTDKTLWCATSQVYNPEPKRQDNADNKLLWGYCLDDTLTPNPTSSPPSSSPIASSPTETPVSPTPSNPPVSMPSPTANTPTPQPQANIVPTPEPSSIVNLELEKFSKQFGIEDFDNGIYNDVILPTSLRENGAVSAQWDGSSSEMRIVLDTQCTEAVEDSFYTLFKQSFPNLDFVANCVNMQRRLQDVQSNELSVKVCTSGDCQTGSPNPQQRAMSTEDILLIALPLTIVALVALLTGLYVYKRRKSLRRTGTTTSKFQQPRARFPFKMKGYSGSVKLPKLGRSKSKTSDRDDSDITTSFVRPEEDADIEQNQNTPRSETSNAGDGFRQHTQSETEHESQPKQTENQGAQQKAGSTTNNMGKSNVPQVQVEPVVETTVQAAEGTNTMSANVTEPITVNTDSTATSAAEGSAKSTSTPSLRKVESATAEGSAETKKGLKEMKCAKCSSKYYSASGKSKLCLNCRDDKRLRKCEKCGTKYISMTGKSTKCLSCRNK